MSRYLTPCMLAAMIACMLSVVPAPARGEYRNERDFNLEPGGRFIIDSGVGSVRISGVSGSGARVKISSNRDDLERLFDLRFNESAGVVEVTLHRHKDFKSPNHFWVKFEVQVPHETSVEVRTGGGSVEIDQLSRDATLNTSGGSIKADDLGASLDAHTSGGSITLRHVTGNAKVDTSGGSIQGDALSGTLDARTSGGSIHFEGVRGDLLAHTSGGSIRIGEAGGRVDARTSGGNVDVNFTSGNARGGHLETSGGGVRVLLDPSVNLEVEASASSGSVSSDLPIKMSGTISTSHLHGTIGSGGELLTLHSDGGPIHIEAR